MDRKLKVWVESRVRYVGEPLVIGLFNPGKLDVRNILLTILDLEGKPISKEFFIDRLPGGKCYFIHIKESDFQEEIKTYNYDYVVFPIIIKLELKESIIENIKTFFRMKLKNEGSSESNIFTFNNRSYYVPNIENYEKIKDILKTRDPLWVIGGKFMGKTEFVRRLEKFTGEMWEVFAKDDILNLCKSEDKFEFPIDSGVNIAIDDFDIVLDEILTLKRIDCFKTLFDTIFLLKKKGAKIVFTTRRLDSRIIDNFGVEIKDNIVRLLPLNEIQILELMEESSVIFDESFIASMPNLSEDDFSLKSKKYFYTPGSRWTAEDIAILFEIYSRYQVYITFLKNSELTPEVFELNSVVKISKRTASKNRLLLVIYDKYRSLSLNNPIFKRFHKIIIVSPHMKPEKVNFLNRLNNRLPPESPMLHRIIGSNPFVVRNFRTELEIKQKSHKVTNDNIFNIIFDFLLSYENHFFFIIRELNVSELLAFLLIYERIKSKSTIGTPRDILDTLPSGYKNINIFDLSIPVSINELNFMSRLEIISKKFISDFLDEDEKRQIINSFYEFAYGESSDYFDRFVKLIRNLIPENFVSGRDDRSLSELIKYLSKLTGLKTVNKASTYKYNVDWVFSNLMNERESLQEFIDHLLQSLLTLRRSLGDVDPEVVKNLLENLKNQGMIIKVDNNIYLPLLFFLLLYNYKEGGI